MKPYLIGIDSDGTAFDSMTIKHCRAFIPALVEIWGLQAHSEKIHEICEFINLYSATRGVNRFIGMKLAFERFEKEGIPVPDHSSIDGFLNAGKPSNASLRDYLERHDSPFLRQLLEWSCLADRYFEKEVRALPPFRGVLPVLKQAEDRAEIAVISSAAEKSLRADWQKENLLGHVTALYGLEFGSKSAQLKAAAGGRFDGSHMLMIGDAAGDHEAARSVGAWFYPIIPGEEERCWEQLRERYLELFLADRYASVQEELLSRFITPRKPMSESTRKGNTDE